MVRPLALVVAAVAVMASSHHAYADAPENTVTITADTATVVTKKVTASIDQDEFLKRFSEAMVKAGYLRNVTLTDRGPGTRDGSTTTTKRYLFAEVQFVERVAPVMFEVEEKVRTWSSYPPTLTITITGPVVSYERVSPHESLEALLGGKQQFTWTFDPPASTGGQTTMNAEFKVLSLNFERAVLRLLKSRFAEALKAYNVTVDQNFILVGFSRVLRDVNEGVLK